MLGLTLRRMTSLITLNITFDKDLPYSIVESIELIGKAYPNLQRLTIIEHNSDDLEIVTENEKKYFPKIRALSYKTLSC